MTPSTTIRRAAPSRRTPLLAAAAAACLAWSAPALAQSDSEDLAKKLSNPVASLISVPLQFNYDRGIGVLDQGRKLTLNVQPVIPITLNEDWNLISRTIVPIVRQDDIVPGAGSQFGFGDITQSLFFSPSKPTAGGIIWGAGPAFLVPSGTDPLLSAHQWGAGPTAVVLHQSGGWTVGALANHIWSFAEIDAGAPNVNQTFLQPFVSYTTADAWTFGLNTESTYAWNTDKLTVPINVTVAKLLRVGHQPISLTFGLRYYALSPNSGPEGFGGRFVLTFLFPK
jgi:hypothetical protein